MTVKYYDPTALDRAEAEVEQAQADLGAVEEQGRLLLKKAEELRAEIATFDEAFYREVLLGADAQRRGELWLTATVNRETVAVYERRAKELEEEMKPLRRDLNQKHRAVNDAVKEAEMMAALKANGGILFR